MHPEEVEIREKASERGAVDDDDSDEDSDEDDTDEDVKPSSNDYGEQSLLSSCVQDSLLTARVAHGAWRDEPIEPYWTPVTGKRLRLSHRLSN